MKRFLLIILIVILATSIILIGPACNIKSDMNVVKILWNKAFARNKIAYVHSVHGDYRNREIFIMNIDGTRQTQLTDSPGDDSEPCFSPDGSKIAFVSDRDGNKEIYIMNVDSSEETRLTDNQANDSRPCFSPDGTKIVFISGRDREEGYSEIYIMNSDGSEQTRLTYDSNRVDFPCFSLDGSKIAFEEVGGIFTMNTDGSEQKMLTGMISNDSHHRLSPDWSKIAVVREGEPGLEGVGILVYIVETYKLNGGSDEASLTKYPAKGISPCFSP